VLQRQKLINQTEKETGSVASWLGSKDTQSEVNVGWVETGTYQS
jgi:hypothetical protein